MDVLFRQEEAASNPQQETRTLAFEVGVKEDSRTCRQQLFFCSLQEECHSTLCLAMMLRDHGPPENRRC